MLIVMNLNLFDELRRFVSVNGKRMDDRIRRASIDKSYNNNDKKTPRPLVLQRARLVRRRRRRKNWRPTLMGSHTLVTIFASIVIQSNIEAQFLVVRPEHGPARHTNSRLSMIHDDHYESQSGLAATSALVNFPPLEGVFFLKGHTNTHSPSDSPPFSFHFLRVGAGARADKWMGYTGNRGACRRPGQHVALPKSYY